jgi:hypothetical protein
VYLASSAEVAGVSGRFFLNSRETRTKPITYQAEVARHLWDVSEELTASDFGAHKPKRELLALPQRQTMEQNSQ